jgi:hypothetical protein
MTRRPSGCLTLCGTAAPTPLDHFRATLPDARALDARAIPEAESSLLAGRQHEAAFIAI